MIITRPENENGPASVGALPSRGSIKPAKDMKVNKATNTTTAQLAPEAARPLDHQLIDISDAAYDIGSLVRAVDMGTGAIANLDQRYALASACGVIIQRMDSLKVLIESAREALESQKAQSEAYEALAKVVDPESMLAAIRAEKARRQSAVEADTAAEDPGRRYPPDLGDLETDICHLYHLIDTLCDVQFEGGDSDRCSALLWIVRDQARKCHDMFGGAA